MTPAELFLFFVIISDSSDNNVSQFVIFISANYCRKPNISLMTHCSTAVLRQMRQMYFLLLIMWWWAPEFIIIVAPAPCSSVKIMISSSLQCCSAAGWWSCLEALMLQCCRTTVSSPEQWTGRDQLKLILTIIINSNLFLIKILISSKQINALIL